MPEILDKCVRSVMDKGHSESSAYAMCRSSLGLKSDGSEDDYEPEIDEDEMKSRLSIALQYQADDVPPLVKEMKVCGPMGRFINGDQKGVMDRKRLTAIAVNFKKHPRQVPIFMFGDHPESNDDSVPVGWVEGLTMEGDDLHARTKLLGPAALAVGGDRVRGASIYTVQGKDYDGRSIGEVLKHLLLTNEPYYKDLNVAASEAGGETVECYFTALNKEDDAMDKTKEKDDLITKLKDEIVELKAKSSDETMTAKLKETETLLQEKTREVAELVASNENLKADVEKFKAPKAVEELNTQLKAAQRQLRAEKVRRLVKTGADRGQFDRALVGDPASGYDHPSDEMVLSWFKASTFKDSMERLDIMLETMPKKTLNRTFGSGPALDHEEVAFTDEVKDQIRRLGHDPEKVRAAMKAKDDKEYSVAVATK